MPNSYKIELGTLIKDRRSEHHLDRTDLAEIADIHARKLISIEHGNFGHKEKGLILYLFSLLPLNTKERAWVNSSMRQIFSRRVKVDAHRLKLTRVRVGRNHNRSGRR